MASRLEQLTEVRQMAASGLAREIRLRAGASQQEVADEIGVDHGTISRWETGKVIPHGDSAIRWLRALQQLAWKVPT